MKRSIAALFFGFMIIVTLPSAVPAKGVNIVTSIYPLADIVRQVGGPDVQADFIVPPGASPHTFEPTPSDMRKIQDAQVFVMIGAGLEFWSQKMIRSAGRKGLKVLVLSKGVTLNRGSHDVQAGKQHTHHSEALAGDPHIWLDPLLVKDMVDKLADALEEVDRRNSSAYRARADKYKRALDSLHDDLAMATKSFTVKEYITFHSAWHYFSRRYGLKVAGVIEETPGKEAAPREVARIIAGIRRIGSGVIFAEPQFNPKVAEVIAREAGAKVLLLDPLGSPHLPGRETYIGLMRYNLSILERAMR